MFELKYMLIIVLIVITIYLIYNLYIYQDNSVSSAKNKIIEEIRAHSDDMQDKLEDIEELFNNRMNDYDKKIKDLYSLQNKVNDINRMNNQHIQQIYHCDDEQLLNTAEASATRTTKNCFVKHNDKKSVDKDMYYMSPVETNEKHATTQPSVHSDKKTQEADNTTIEMDDNSESSVKQKKSVDPFGIITEQTIFDKFLQNDSDHENNEEINNIFVLDAGLTQTIDRETLHKLLRNK